MVSLSVAPRHVRREIADLAGERVLAAQVDAEGAWHAGTPEALYVVDASGRVRVPWEVVERLGWDADDATLAIEATLKGEPVRWTLGLTGAGRLVELGRERVEASIVGRARRAVPGSGTASVTVLARRSPVGAGPITFQYALDRGLSGDDEGVREVIAEALAVVRDDLGERGS